MPCGSLEREELCVIKYLLSRTAGAVEEPCMLWVVRYTAACCWLIECLHPVFLDHFALGESAILTLARNNWCVGYFSLLLG